MHPEIADSDAESDFDPPDKPAHVPENESEAAHAPLASSSEVDFDQFLDPTQRLWSSASYELNNVSQLDGPGDSGTQPEANGVSADTHLTSLSIHMSPAVTAKKRVRSALQDGSNDASHDGSGKKAKSKRSKTYGATTRPRSALGDDLFAPSLASFSELKNSEPEDAAEITANQAISGSPSASAEPSMLVATSSSGQSGVISLLGRSVPEAAPLMSTSMASIGQYQSINLDFRGGLDVNANPFGPLSQVSLEGDPNQRAGGQQPSYNHVNPSNFGVPEDQLLPPTSQSSPHRPLASDLVQLIQNDDSAPAPHVDSHSQGPEPMVEVTDCIVEAVLPSTEKPLPKKRCRKPKDSTLNSTLRAPSLSEDVDELALPSMPPPNRSRRGTVDSISQASEASGPVSSTRNRIRGKSKNAIVDGPVEPDESSLAKQPTNELDLSDEIIIGLPKEAYKPRPSRSRSKVTAEEEELPNSKYDESSPAKLPSSGLGLSDEAAIGLPKDNYKPRPSRSRSKKVVDETPNLPPPEEELDHQTPMKSSTFDVPEAETPPVPLTKSGVKKGRKAKVKRAKTSAAALLKKIEPMLSEGEDDVVWMDTKPAPVKLELPPDLKALKKEPDMPDADQDEDDIVAHKRSTVKDTHITIEIPSNAEAKNLVAEPKKRGRKPKKMQQKVEEKVVDEEEERPPQEGNMTSRPALAEKSSNVRADGQDTIESPPVRGVKSTPTVSPFTSPEPESGVQSKSAKPAVKEKENQPLTTPAKPKPSAAPLSAEKGPTKHSPITSLTNSGRKAIYRVGLSRRQNIPSLLRKVDRDKPPPKNLAIKQKERKVKMDEHHDGEEGGGRDPGEMRGPDGMLIEWEF
ncbi:hypothetical protein PV04_08610 [Phialophora macrospora]|uniref:Uncharacterized protein n=1 Tax=Phialophora macrospora TaxID=1851006 RepID=A0A0D2FU77_9EURO|nr:hypothetical protein PV04_08610 [Phialophora macrospora]